MDTENQQQPPTTGESAISALDQNVQQEAPTSPPETSLENLSPVLMGYTDVTPASPGTGKENLEVEVTAGVAIHHAEVVLPYRRSLQAEVFGHTRTVRPPPGAPSETPVSELVIEHPAGQPPETPVSELAIEHQPEEPHETHVSELAIEHQPEEPLEPPGASALNDLSPLPLNIKALGNSTQDSGPVIERTSELDLKLPDTVKSDPPASEEGCFTGRLPLSLQDFRCCTVLGKGSYGKVVLAELKRTKHMYAIKALRKTNIVKRNKVKRLMLEKEIFMTVSNVHHPFLVNLLASFHTEHHIFFAMEFAAGGDLVTNINNAHGVFLERRAVFYAACVTLGLEFLHERKIAHRDVKMDNIVIDHQGFAKLTDFGLCRTGMGFGDRANTFCGTLHYMAPEMLTELSYTRDVDWWSLGIVIYSMLVGKTPFTGKNSPILRSNIISSEVQYPQHLSPESISIMKHLLRKTPTMRLGSSENDADDVKTHAFFREIQWTQLMLKGLKPPFTPNLTGPKDTTNFEEDLTSQNPNLTPPRGPKLTEEEQEVFKNFEWIAEWAT